MTAVTNKSLPTTVVVGSARRLPLPLRLFIISLVVPFFFQLGPVQMSVNRILLTLWVLPCVIMWLRGRGGRIRVSDLALLSMCLCVAASYLVLHGLSLAIEPSGIFFIETMGAYLMARCYVRSADDFYAVVRLLFWIVLLMLPFAIYETRTGNNILLELANKVTFSGSDVSKDPRWGLDRVQGVFQHPILFGVFCGGIVALTYYVLGYGASPWKRWFQTFLVTGTAFLSLSSGPLTAIIAQLGLIFWDRALHSVKRRWEILSGGVFSVIVAVEIAANRSTPEIFISIFAFNTWTAYNRIRIWQFGTASVADKPLFGVGLNEWHRPEWMSSSLDMFWLLPAVINGLPAALCLHLAFFALFLGVLFKPTLSDRAAQYRVGYLVCMTGFYLGGWTVHYWKVIYVFFIFLLGCGAWLLDDDGNDNREVKESAASKARRNVLRYTRYETSHSRRGSP